MLHGVIAHARASAASGGAQFIHYSPAAFVAFPEGESRFDRHPFLHHHLCVGGGWAQEATESQHGERSEQLLQ